MTSLTHKAEIRKAINQYCEAKGLSRNEFATQVGISSATISKIDNDDFDSISERLLKKVWNKVGTDKIPQIIDTSDYKACIRVCDNARRHQFMIGLIADTGMGKTTALSAYSLKKNVFYLSYDKTSKPKQFFISLLREMGISFEGSINEMVNKIADELNVLSNPLLIIDEAGKITHTMILYLHVLRDKTYKNCGIVLAGMPYFKSNLIKFSNKEKEGYAEFTRRVNVWHSLIGLTRAEVAYICQANGISDGDVINEMKHNKRFGDLMNEILLYQIEINE